MPTAFSFDFLLPPCHNIHIKFFEVVFHELYLDPCPSARTETDLAEEHRQQPRRP